MQFLAARVRVLMRIGRLTEGRAVAENEHRLAERLDNLTLLATSEPDLGLVTLMPAPHVGCLQHALMSTGLL